MPSPFPGMNPYLEHLALWSGVYHRLITAIANQIAPQIRPKYIVAIEERVYEVSGETSLLVGVLDVSMQRVQTTKPTSNLNLGVAAVASQPIEVTLPLSETLTEGYLEIRAVATGEVITAIEVLSPKNKLSAAGRLQYETKRQKVLGSATHLVEIDLLRQGEPMPILEQGIQSHYRILVSRSEIRPKAQLYGFNLPQRVPVFPVPLEASEAEPLVDLQRSIDEIYDQGGYDLRIDYSREPVPGLAETDALWVKELLRSRGFSLEPPEEGRN
ncbi:MAG: DUF4058 family protein [Cyanosarcina radialis HA8281-LM2]|jgi:hypothetical protein|nr:DUF4058 family protein [Cyanosarcina radialis HA8281-LM2]